MLPAARRIRRSTDFAAAVRAGRRVGRGSLVVHLAPPPPTVSPQGPSAPGDTVVVSAPATDRTHTTAPSRAGFVVSKAVGPAVVRNKVKRRLRHLVSARLDALPPGSALVVRALPPAATASYERLGHDLDDALAAAAAPRRVKGGRR